jgi:hypothetical protein
MKSLKEKLLFRLIFLVMVFPMGAAHGQLKDLSEEIKALNARTDSMKKETEQIQARMDSNLKARERERFDEYLKQNQRNLEEFMSQRREEEEKQKKRLWLRGGLLLIFFISVIYGWMKRRKRG